MFVDHVLQSGVHAFIFKEYDASQWLLSIRPFKTVQTVLFEETTRMS